MAKNTRSASLRARGHSRLRRTSTPNPSAPPPTFGAQAPKTEKAKFYNSIIKLIRRVMKKHLYRLTCPICVIAYV